MKPFLLIHFISMQTLGDYEEILRSILLGPNIQSGLIIFCNQRHFGRIYSSVALYELRQAYSSLITGLDSVNRSIGFGQD